MYAELHLNLNHLSKIFIYNLVSGQSSTTAHQPDKIRDLSIQHKKKGRRVD
jgi:L-rhamnose isomerase